MILKDLNAFQTSNLLLVQRQAHVSFTDLFVKVKVMSICTASLSERL